jgi:glycosyltransferase involved in cell wall biosynthesis
MRIAQFAHLGWPVPAPGYGAIQRIVHYLTEDLIGLGADVTLFAAQGSRSTGRVVEICEPLAHSRSHVQSAATERIIAERIDELAEFDLVHFHTLSEHCQFESQLKTRAVSTAHAPPHLVPVIDSSLRHPGFPRIAVSDHQRSLMPALNWIDMIHLGLPPDLYAPRFELGNYLAFIGRICRDKGVLEAIEIARRAGMKLVLAGPVFGGDARFFDEEVRQHIESREVYYVGEIDDARKQKFYEKAYALLFPIMWDEPFGTVMIEAMACGTPTIAFRRGAVPEVITEGVNGIIVEGVEEAVDRLIEIRLIRRQEVRRAFEARFSAALMARRYEQMYRKLLSG